MKNLRPSAKPKKNKDVIQKELEGTIYLMNPHEMTIHTLNDTAAFIWARCNGKIPLQRIAQKLADEYGVSQKTVLSDVTEFVNLYLAHGMLEAQKT